MLSITIATNVKQLFDLHSDKELHKNEYWDASVSSGLELYDFEARFYEPQLGRWFVPDPVDWNSNPYLAMGNNPVVYVDPDGEFIWIAIGIGAAIGAYIGGSTANGGDLNPVQWDWESGDTWAGIGLGAIAGGAGGLGFYYAAPALAGSATAGTGLAGVFGASGTVAAYTLAGGVSMGLAGYGAGFAGGMVHSNGNLNYGHQAGIFGAQVGSAIGSAVGAVYGLAKGIKPTLPERNNFIRKPIKSFQWNGPYFQGSEEEAQDLLLSSSKFFEIETSYWSTSKGFYFSPIKGDAYGISYDRFNSKVLNYNTDLGYQMNTFKSAYRYTVVENLAGAMYLTPNVFFRSRIFYHVHTHPQSSPPSPKDLSFSYYLNIPARVLGWNGVTFNFGGNDYWK